MTSEDVQRMFPEILFLMPEFAPTRIVPDEAPVMEGAGTSDECALAGVESPTTDVQRIRETRLQKITLLEERWKIERRKPKKYVFLERKSKNVFLKEQLDSLREDIQKMSPYKGLREENEV
ncbi:hypothetical protein Q1695_005421 [Nippostrongylus brasiliensis]|nr:hypothetical protein Q1695_005421 [Nippostrongylus brasiliensis]